MSLTHILETTTYPTWCPWCNQDFTVEVTIGFINSRAPLSRRTTGINVHRVNAVFHECVDPTSTGEREWLS